MISYKEFSDIICDIKDRCYKVGKTNSTIDLELEKDMVMTYLYLKLEELHKCTNTMFLLDTSILDGTPTDLKKLYNVYRRELQELGGING